MNWKLLNRVWHANLGMTACITLGVIALSCPFIAHQWDFAFGRALMDIHYGKFLAPSWRWVWTDSQGLLLGFLVISGVLMHRKAVRNAVNKAADDPAAAGSSVTLIDLAGTACAWMQAGQARGLRIFHCTTDTVTKLSLENERWLVLASGMTSHQIIGLLAGVKLGSLKRLEYVLLEEIADDEAESVARAFACAGAKPLALPAGAQPWPERVLDALCRRSATLTLLQRKTMPVRAKAAPAFTLLEMLLSIFIFTLLAGGTVGALGRLARAEHIHTAATELAAMVRDARSLAVREDACVRLAFLPDGGEPKLLGTGDPDHPRMGCAMYVLRRPAVTSPAALVIQPTAALESTSSLVEVVSTSRVPLPRSLLAGWDFAPGHQRWLLWDESVRIKGELFGDSTDGGSAAFAPRTHLWQPPSIWSATQRPHIDAPPDHDLTPVKPQRRLVFEPLGEEDSVTLPAGDMAPAASIWGALPVLHWSADEDEGAELIPAIDFLPDGTLACAPLRDNLTFEFHHRYNARQRAVHVVIDTHTAEAHIE